MLREYLFGEDPYAGFPVDDYDLDRRGFNLPEQALGLVAEVQPSRIIEVGTWRGQSAFFMADLLTGAGLTFEMACVDTWLGATEMWLDAVRHPHLREVLELEHGRPRVYEQFLANVIKLGYQDAIVPLPAPSMIAWKVLCVLRFTAQFIYIDGNHDRFDVAHDVVNYWRLLEPGGIMVGDDYGWPGVNSTVNQFVAKLGLRLETAPEEFSWWIRKPARGS